VELNVTQCGPKVLGMIFLHRCTVSEKLPKIPLFGPSLIHWLWLLGSQQHPQCRVRITSFSTWGTENSLAEINLESTGGGDNKKKSREQKFSFRIRRTTVLGMFKGFAITLNEI
jgi:hypothetical protein